MSNIEKMHKQLLDGIMPFLVASTIYDVNPITENLKKLKKEYNKLKDKVKIVSVNPIKRKERITWELVTELTVEDKTVKHISYSGYVP